MIILLLSLIGDRYFLAQEVNAIDITLCSAIIELDTFTDNDWIEMIQVFEQRNRQQHIPAATDWMLVIKILLFPFLTPYWLGWGVFKKK